MNHHMNYTKGKWKSSCDEPSYIVDECEKVIARIATSYRRADEVKANADLVEAAPEMFAALEIIKTFYDDFEKHPLVPVSTIRNLIDSTLKKARGEK